MTLYELADEYMALADSLFDEDADIGAILSELGDTREGIEDKLLNLARIVKNKEADIDAMKAAESRLYERRKASETRVASLKGYMFDAMQRTQITRASDALFTVAIQRNPASVHVIDESALPDHYLVPQPPKINRSDILRELKAGAEIPGAELQQTEGLRIR